MALWKCDVSDNGEKEEGNTEKEELSPLFLSKREKAWNDYSYS